MGIKRLISPAKRLNSIWWTASDTDGLFKEVTLSEGRRKASVAPYAAAAAMRARQNPAANQIVLFYSRTLGRCRCHATFLTFIMVC